MTVHPVISELRSVRAVRYVGHVRRVLPMRIDADGPLCTVGTVCRVGREGLLAEVVGLDGQQVTLVPYSDPKELSVGAVVEALPEGGYGLAGHAVLGRAVDGFGRPIDGGPPILSEGRPPLFAPPPQPLARAQADKILVTGIAALDGLVPLGRGQRIGLFAASGVGKTSLVSQLVRQVNADVCVCCLVGERGHEVEQFWSRDFEGEARSRSVLIAATSDQPAAVRMRAVYQAMAVARSLRESGRDVFLVLDSITRFAMALRELGLAAGEPPTVRGYTPGVFSALPRVVEQAGRLKGGGSITAVFTVLSETDDVDDPLCELMKSLLDGHWVLSRSMAEKGQFPAVDPLRSVSRNAESLMSTDHRQIARRALALLACHESSRTLIEAGLYQKGTNPDVDAAVEAQPKLMDVMRQELFEKRALSATLAELKDAVISDG